MIAARGHAARRWFGALGVSCALLAAGAQAQAPAAALSLDQLMELLGQRHHGHVAFTEVTRLAIVDRPLQSSGELLYDAPDRLEKRTLAPKQETLLLERGTLTVQRGHRSRVLSLRDYPQIVPFRGEYFKLKKSVSMTNIHVPEKILKKSGLGILS